MIKSRSLKAFQIVLLGLGVMTSTLAVAAQGLPDPVALLNEVTQGVVGEIKSENSNNDNSKAIFEIVNRRIVPHADFEEMAQWVSGREAWFKASAQDRSYFIEQFKTLVIRTYANALMTYSKQKIEFLPLREDWRQKPRVQVQSLIIERGKNPLHVDYKLVRRQDDWRVYDIVIEGVSLIKGYTAQFNQKIRQTGLMSVARDIAARNSHVDKNG